MIAIDAIIDNNDRNNGNWGVLTVRGETRLAPVFDNGNSFSSKVDDEHLDLDPEAVLAKWRGGRSIYERSGHQLSNGKLFASDICGLAEAAERLLGRFSEVHDDIVALVESVPESVCSPRRREAYLMGMDVRARWLAEDFGLE